VGSPLALQDVHFRAGAHPGVAAMVMTGLRQVTTGIGLVDQTPPDAILKQRAFGVLVRYPRVACFVARRQVALVELAHWAYGAAAGAAFAQPPEPPSRRGSPA
jgi:hypothetical protein